MAAGQGGKAEELRRLHRAPELLVLVNVWDVASARVVAGAPGCRAIATASWSIAAALGFRDGEQLPRDDMLATVGRIASAVDQPVTADLETGFGATPADVAQTIASAIEAGVVGCNLEDGVDDREAPLRPTAEHAERVTAARVAGERAGVPIVINARTDVYIERVGAPEQRFEMALDRGRAYREAGADCVFVPGLAELDTIERLVGELRSVSVLAGAHGPALDDLQRIGVARVSFGPGPMGVAMAALRDTAVKLLSGGAPPETLGWRPPTG
jgi:2-methylisocitrate lyase-like PEP mutase family enzyme